jgi:hypothetical protein
VSEVRELNQREERLAAALRELAAVSRQGASPELELMLKDSFRRHHARRRVLRLRVATFAICVLALGLSFLLRFAWNNNAVQPAVVRTIPPEEVSAPPQASVFRMSRPIVRARPGPRSNRSAVTNAFVALPSFAMVPAGDELRVIRLEMPGADLRLVGAPVGEEIAGRRVTADFVVGHDGTPYAMRLVNTSFDSKENHP